MAHSPEGDATLDAIAAFEAAVTSLDTIIAAANANPSTGWDSATGTQRTTAIKNLATAVRGLAYVLKGIKTPLGTNRAPD
jgi:hypothetical protein